MTIKITLAKACRRRMAGAPMTVTERAAYRMMESGEALREERFMAEFAKKMGLRQVRPKVRKKGEKQS